MFEWLLSKLSFVPKRFPKAEDSDEILVVTVFWISFKLKTLPFDKLPPKVLVSELVEIDPDLIFGLDKCDLGVLVLLECFGLFALEIFEDFEPRLILLEG